MTPDIGHEKFNSVYDEYLDADFNEADTRAKIIDKILKDVLGWAEKDIAREYAVNSGFIDYRLNQNGICKLVIEAKRSDDYFLIPPDKNNRYYKISGAISSVRNLISAMTQAKHYCDDIGCKHAVVSNGSQFIVFSAITIGKPWKDFRCLVFNSLHDIKSNFALFYSVLSRDAVLDGSLNTYINEHKSRLKFQKIIDMIHNPDYTWSRNELYTYIRPIADVAFHELLDDSREDILRKCYVHEKTKDTADEMDSFFRDRLPHFSGSFAVSDLEEDEHGSSTLDTAMTECMETSAEGNLIVLLGGVGVGKSTFIHRYYKVVLTKVPNFYWFYIDFRKTEPRVDALEEFIFRSINEQFLKKYKPILAKDDPEISFEASVSELKAYYSKLFRDIKKDGAYVSIVIDNIDQHDIGLQESIFLYASSICDLLKSITLISVRENTFLMSTRLGVFDAYDIPKFHIAAPNFLSLIVKRLDYAINLLSNDDFDQKFRPMPLDKKEQLAKYFNVIKLSLIYPNPQAKKIVRFIDNVSVGNMREALRMFNNFIVSGNTNINEIFAKLEAKGSYQIAFHQFIKSILLGERRYYNQDKSNIMNLYDFDTSLTDSYSNSFRILQYLYEKKNSQSPIGTGYIDINNLLIIGQEINISREIMADSLERLARFNLIELDNLSRTEISKASYAKITYAGIFYLNELSHQFVYLDTVMADTPISDDDIFESLKQKINETEIPNRLERVQEFTQYLKEFEEVEFKNYPELTSHHFTCTSFLNRVHNEFLLQIPSILDNFYKRKDEGS